MIKAKCLICKTEGEGKTEEEALSKQNHAIGLRSGNPCSGTKEFIRIESDKKETPKIKKTKSKKA